MNEPKYKLDQEVWITNKRWFQKLTSRDKEIFDTISYRVSAIVMLPDRENFPSYGKEVGYYLMDEEGTDHIYEHDFDMERMKSFPEKVVHKSYESAVMEIMSMIEGRIQDLEDIKLEYVNKVEEYKNKGNLIDDDLFKMHETDG